MRALITGYTGFVGSHLAEALLQRGTEVYGLYRWRSRLENVRHLQDRVQLVEGDIADAAAMRHVLEVSRPDEIYHLAAQSFVPTSWTSPGATMDTNIQGELNLFEAVRQLKISPRIQIAGSSEEYGLVHEEELPITEDQPLRPLSPYAVSKVAQDLLAYQYFRSYGIDVVRTRGFNHTGPRRGQVFVCSNFAWQIARIERGEAEPVIKAGNLEARRDFTDVRDIVRGYQLALQKAESGEVYNLCSGRAWSIRQILDHLLSRSEVEVKVEFDPARARPSDVPVLKGSAEKFHKIAGWKPEIPFEDTLDEILDHWRKTLASTGGSDS
jgi:GDP-4-dehydro-6-deoxy-D-mannose reductase